MSERAPSADHWGDPEPFIPVGAADIAERFTQLGTPTTTQTVKTWNYRRQQREHAAAPPGRPPRQREESMPAPRREISGVPVWAWEDVEAWGWRTGRLVPEHARRSEREGERSA